MLTAGQADSRNLLYGLLYGNRVLHYNAGQNPWVITNTAGEWKFMGPNDQFLLSLPTDSMKCFGMGVANPYTMKPFPIPGKYVLEESEINNLKTRVAAFNQIIATAANTYGLAIVDMHGYLANGFVSGMTYDGITYNTTFVSGGMFSTDGIHLCPRGNAIAANFFIKAINFKYGCNIPQAQFGNYPGLAFP
ncbi:MAG: hypothetical protein WCL00_06495 [Bacteroidota bacterium]